MRSIGWKETWVKAAAGIRSLHESKDSMQCSFRKSLGKYFISTVLLSSLVWLHDYEYLVPHTVAYRAALIMYSLNDKSIDFSDLCQESNSLLVSYKLVCLSFIQVSFPFYLLETPICYYMLSLLKHSLKGAISHFKYCDSWQHWCQQGWLTFAGWFTPRSCQEIISNGRMGRLLRKRC